MNKQDFFETEKIPKAVMKLAIPTIVATIITIIYNLTDTFFVGRLGDTAQSAAVTLSGNITLLFIAVENLFGIGGSSLFGRAMGEKNEELAQRCSGFSIWGTVAVSVAFSFLYQLLADSICEIIGATEENLNYTKQYLFYAVEMGALPAILSTVFAFLIRTEGRATVATIGVSLGAIVNVVLDPILILPGFLNMGVAGAGLATLIGNCLACLFFIIFILVKRKNTNIVLYLKYAIPTKEVAKEVMGVGIPGAIQNALNVVGIGVLNRLSSGYGSEAVAAMGISFKLYMMPMYIVTAFNQGVTPIISYCFGAKKFERIKESILFATKVILAFSFTAAILVAAFATPLVTAFLNVDVVIKLGTIFTRTLLLGLPFLAVDFGGIAVYQAVGMGRESLFFAIGRKVILEIPLLLLFNHYIGVYGLGLATPVTEAILAVVTIFVLRALLKKWSSLDEK